MENENAKVHVQKAKQQLQSSTDYLNNALSTVEQPQNKENIEKTLKAVHDAMQIVNDTLNTYQE
ncbi:EscE/YscE/SsaE family type III secretion system needle protein co-chaperone [Tepidibacter aestuarii]|uniref:EscE/YscE/SsaE family type III secretion system needle protein co-chaperone n=1 Tax=Tepidibacter aestuarii TaxID=2925782 RepID=UPI0020BFC99D|nr:EscE/YscE/SsaE family type III secretion system needle protein co-chaperone [Tepidibacter aestuarii]CAH2214378.1 conserved protein of unknown function [Tepidibacter aestuarii]